jgi:hypothetical protein
MYYAAMKLLNDDIKYFLKIDDEHEVINNILVIKKDKPFVSKVGLYGGEIFLHSQDFEQSLEEVLSKFGD